MTVIDTDPGFDTLTYVRTLKAAGVEGKQAEAHATRLRGCRLPARIARAGLATKADLRGLRAGIAAEIERAANRTLLAIMALNTILFAAMKFL